MSGIYILKTKDEYRVAYSDKYYDLIDFDEENNYNINGKIAKTIFSDSVVFGTIDKALQEAKKIARQYDETDDGIQLIRYAENVDYGDLINDSHY